jgi:hypothetical protein
MHAYREGWPTRKIKNKVPILAKLVPEENPIIGVFARIRYSAFILYIVGMRSFFAISGGMAIDHVGVSRR